MKKIALTAALVAIAGPVLADPHAAGDVLQSVPMELDEDPAIFIAVDLAFANDHRRFRTLHFRPRQAAFRLERRIIRHQNIAALVGRFIAARIA